MKNLSPLTLVAGVGLILASGSLVTAQTTATAGPTAAAAAPVPDVLEALESLQLAPDLPPWIDSEAHAGPLSPQATPRRIGDNEFTGGLTAPVAAPDAAAAALDAPPLPEGGDALTSPSLEASLPRAPEGAPAPLQPVFPAQSLENQPLGVLNPPGFLNSKRGFQLGGGRVRYGAQIEAGLAYNDNVLGTPSNPQGDVIFSLQPSIYLETGKKTNVRFLWAPSVMKYARFKRYDTVNQTFLFSSRTRLTKLELGLDASYITQSGLFLNSQGQASQKTLFARLFGTYPLTRKTTLNMALEGSGVESDPGGRSFQGSFNTSVDFRYSSKTTVGAGINVGYFNSSSGTTTYQTFLLRLLYNPTARLTFSGEGGIQFRQSPGSGGGAASTAVMSLLLSYRPSDKTTISGRFFRNVDVDTFAPGDLQIVTAIQGSISWQATERAQIEASVLSGYSESTSNDGNGNYFFNQANLAVSYALLDDVNVRVFSNLQQRLRDTQGDNYFSTTSGMSLGMRF